MFEPRFNITFKYILFGKFLGLHFGRQIILKK